jgi:anti-sigma regulatory factor (Ser/Thr protein kinase)
MTLTATPDSVPMARRFVADRVRRCPVGVASNCLLLASELATNCVLHARTDYVVRVVVDDDHVRVEVADSEPDMPRREAPGNGLRMVESLATAWGIDPCAEGQGKVVWFELRG